MNFIPNKVAFGRHESFPLRFGWLPKGFQEFQKDPGIFSKDEAIVQLGVGRNMVNSIKHWLRAARILETTQTGFEATDLGKRIFLEDGWDPYLEDEGTIWLIHWLITSNPEHATAWYWFFNLFHKPEFSNNEVATSLLDFAEENIQAKFSPTTVRQDIAVLLRSYVQSKGRSQHPAEESLDSPLSVLNLITYSSASKLYKSGLGRRDGLPLGVFGYAITEVFNRNSINQIPIDELMYTQEGQIAPGSVFRLTESAFLAKLEQLINYVPEIYKITETAGVHQLFKLKEVDEAIYLEQHYKKYIQGKAA